MFSPAAQACGYRVFVGHSLRNYWGRFTPTRRERRSTDWLLVNSYHGVDSCSSFLRLLELAQVLFRLQAAVAAS